MEFKLNAAARIQEVKAASDELAITKATHLPKSKYSAADFLKENAPCTVYGYVLTSPNGPAQKIWVSSHGITTLSKAQKEIGKRGRYKKQGSGRCDSVFVVDAKGNVKGTGDEHEVRPTYVFK